jgi:hypothetical protein
LCVAVIGILLPVKAHADQLAPRSLTISSSLAGQHNLTYKVSVGMPSTSVVGSIRIQFCSNTALVDDSCVAPFGLDDSGAVLTAQTGATGFIISTSNSTGNEIVLSRPPTIQLATTANYTFDNITNPSNGGSYYARVFTYSSSDGTGSYIDAGGLAFAISPSLGVSAEVPPYLTFCVGEIISGLDCTTATDPFSDLGTLAPTVTSAAQSQLLVATNASDGYSMWVTGSTMTSGNNVLPAMSGGVSQQGASQFGLNLRANTNPAVGQNAAGPGFAAIAANYNQPDHFRFLSGDTLASSPFPDDYRKYTVSYIVNVAANQPGGIYSTTLTYIVLGNF